MLHPYAWGVRLIEVDVTGLAGGVLRLDDLSLVFPDGDLVNAPAEDALPPPLSLASVPPQAMEVVFYVAPAPVRHQAGNVAMDDAADDGTCTVGTPPPRPPICSPRRRRPRCRC